jgi:hypothetical protein
VKKQKVEKMKILLFFSLLYLGKTGVIGHIGYPKCKNLFIDGLEKVIITIFKSIS